MRGRLRRIPRAFSAKTQASLLNLCRYCAVLNILFVLLMIEWPQAPQNVSNITHTVMVKSNSYMVGNKLCNMNNGIQNCQVAKLYSNIDFHAQR